MRQTIPALVLLLLLSVVWPSTGGAKNHAGKKILIVHSYDRNYKTFPLLMVILGLSISCAQAISIEELTKVIANVCGKNSH